MSREVGGGHLTLWPHSGIRAGPRDCWPHTGPCLWIPGEGATVTLQHTALRAQTVLSWAPSHQAISPSQRLQYHVWNMSSLGWKDSERSVFVLCDWNKAPESKRQPPVYRGSTRTSPALLRRQTSLMLGQPFTQTCEKMPRFSESRTQRPDARWGHVSLGMEHVCIIYIWWSSMFLRKHENRQYERTPGPVMLSVTLRLLCYHFVCCVKQKHQSKRWCMYMRKINCISFQYIQLYILVFVYFLFIVDKRMQTAFSS